MTQLYRYIITVAAVLALSLSGCINDDALCPPEEPGDDDGMAVTLMFTVATRSASEPDDDAPLPAPSRADDCFADRPGTAAEDFINTSDCQFLLFDADRKLICPIFPELITAKRAEYTLYSVKATITDQYFEEAVKKAGDGGIVYFYIMVVANTRSAAFNGQYLAYLPGITTISELAGQRKTFDLPPRRAGNNIVTWSPSTDMTAGNFIPMAGLQKFDVPASSLAATTEEAPLDLSSDLDTGKKINMLRSMAKIEVIDKIPAEEGIKIKNVELVGFNTEGTIMPLIGNGGQWPDFITAQVGDVTMPSTDCYTKPTKYDPHTYPADGQDILRFFGDEQASTDHHEGYPVYSGYVTEYDQSNATGYEKPYIVVTLVDSDGNDATLYYRMFELDKYGLEALLRNHIYRYEITGLTGDVGLTVKWTVCNMDTGTAVIVFN